mgnify:CR=1 FL=1
MSTFRVNKNVNYTVMSNHHLQDKRLSLKAKGLLSYMLSLPDDWDYSLKGLTVGCKDGLDSVRTAVLELEEHGYVRRQKVRKQSSFEKSETHPESCWADVKNTGFA